MEVEEADQNNSHNIKQYKTEIRVLVIAKCRRNDRKVNDRKNNDG